MENCKPDEFDDGLTCRKKCEPGYVDDGLTCRKPITSSIDPCPGDSEDVAGTCWGTVRQDCIDDCFRHPAPGCRTYECGRLHWAGVDWGPKLCTDCNLRCGQTCWNVKGITRQLHERNLRLSGGEVILQAIRGKTIQGRVDWEATIAEIKGGLENAFGNDSGLAKLFDPEKNGVAAAFRKFGDDTKGAFEEIGRKTKEAFDKMGADAKAAFEKFARDAEGNLTNLLGKEFMDKMKDPKFWIEAAAIMAQVGATILGVLVTAGTLGVGAAAGAAIIMAGNMVAPAIRMIGKAAMGEPIDALDIADMALSAIPAPGPGKAATSLIGKAAQAVIRNGSTIKAIGGLVIAGVQAGQAMGMIPSSCLGPNCPAPPPPLGPPDQPIPRPPPDMPPKPPPAPPGQLTDEEIMELQPADTVNKKMGPPGARVDNPKYMALINWINKYRFENYGTPIPPLTVGPGALATPNDVKLDNIPTSEPQAPVEIPENATLEGDTIEEYVPFVGNPDEEVIQFTFDGEGEEEGEQVTALGEVVTEPPTVLVNPPTVPTKPEGRPLTDEEIIELQPADTVNKKITVDGKRVDNPKYIAGVAWIEQYKANLAKLPEKPPTTGELIAQGVEPIEAVEQVQAETAEITPFEPIEGEEGEEEIVFDDEEGPADEIVPFVPTAGEPEEELLFGDEEAPVDMEASDEIVPFVPTEGEPDEEELVFEEEAPVGMVLDEEAPVGMVIDKIDEEDEEEKELLDTNKYVFERPGEECPGHFQEEDLTGGANDDETYEPIEEGDILSNPFGFMKTTKEYPFIPKTHRGNDFVVACYAAKNPEVAKAMNDDPDRLTSHWIEEGAKQGLDGDCGPSNTTVEERLAIIREKERKKLELEGKKTNCAATDRFWVLRGDDSYCDGKRTAAGERRSEAYECEEKGNYWDSDYGYKFCNKFLDVNGNPKSGKEFCASKNHFPLPGGYCTDTRNLDGTDKRLGDFCQDIGLKYENDPSVEENVLGVKMLRPPHDISDQKVNTLCNAELLDVNGEPVDFEKMCVDTVSYYDKDSKTCDINKFPNGVVKPPEYVAKNTIRHDNSRYLAMPYDRASLREFYDMKAPKESEGRAIRWHRWEVYEKQQKADVLRDRIVEIAKQILELFNLDWAVEHYRKEMNNYGYNFVRPFFDPEGVRSSPKDKVIWEHEQKFKWLKWWYWEGKYQGIPGDKIQKINEDVSLVGPNAPGGGFPGWFEEYYNKNYTYWNVYNNPELQARKQEDYEKFIKEIFGNTIEETERKMKAEGKGKGKSKPATLTLHWADWCPHCHDMMPEWKKLGSEHKGVLIRAVEQKQSGFKGPFPAILFQHGNSMEKYEGPRTKVAFAKFLKNKLG